RRLPSLLYRGFPNPPAVAPKKIRELHGYTRQYTLGTFTKIGPDGLATKNPGGLSLNSQLSTTNLAERHGTTRYDTARGTIPSPLTPLRRVKHPVRQACARSRANPKASRGYARSRTAKKLAFFRECCATEFVIGRSEQSWSKPVASPVLTVASTLCRSHAPTLFNGRLGPPTKLPANRSQTQTQQTHRTRFRNCQDLPPNLSCRKDGIVHVKIEQAVHQVPELRRVDRKRLLRDGTRRDVRHHRRKIEYR